MTTNSQDSVVRPPSIVTPYSYAGRWPVAQLKTLVFKIGSGATPTGGQDSYQSARTNYALVRSQNVLDRRFDEAGLAFITDQQADRLRGAAIQRGDILLNITGDGVTFGRACQAPDEVLPACVNQHVSIIRVDPHKAVPGYILAYLTHPLTKRYIESFNSGGSRRAITKGHIESFKVPLPPIVEQCVIADILGTLDDKIELNRRMNQTLEEIARAIFKSWFIDFDPVRAKAEGRQPAGMDAATAALFPDAFEDSELGPIPAGWSMQALKELADLNARTLGRRHNLEFIDYVEISAVSRGDISTISRFEVGAEPSRARRILRHGDTVISTVRPDRAAHFLCLNPTPELIASTGFAVLSSRSNNWAFLYLAATRPEVGVELGRLADGGAYPAIRPEVVGNIRVSYPNDTRIVQVFEKLTQPLLSRSEANRVESRTLANIRDTLLPKLLSGEIRVPQAERELAGVGV